MCKIVQTYPKKQECRPKRSDLRARTKKQGPYRNEALGNAMWLVVEQHLNQTFDVINILESTKKTIENLLVE